MPVKLTANQTNLLNAMEGFFNHITAAEEKADNMVAVIFEDLSKATGKSIASVRGTAGALIKQGLLREVPSGDGIKRIGVTDAGIDIIMGKVAVEAAAEADQPKAQAAEGATPSALEMFYDSEHRVWTVLLMDASENQIGDAMYEPKRAAAENMAKEQAKKHGLPGFTLFNTRRKQVKFTFTSKGMSKEVVS